MTITAPRFPPHQQPIGTALFGVTAVLGPVFGPLLGGWLTEAFSWHYAFLINVPVCIVLVVLLLIGLPKDRMRLDLLGEADWLGVFGLSLGLGGMTVVLEEGNREQWFSSPPIIQVTVLSVVGFIMMIVGQCTAKRPVVRLSLLLDRQFGSVAVMATVLGMVLYGTAYMIPQFLAAIADYDALQAGEIVMISGLPMMVLMVMTPLLMRLFGLRVAGDARVAGPAAGCLLRPAPDARRRVGPVQRRPQYRRLAGAGRHRHRAGPAAVVPFAPDRGKPAGEQHRRAGLHQRHGAIAGRGGHGPARAFRHHHARGAGDDL